MNSIVPSNNSVSAKQAFPFEQEIIQWDLESAISRCAENFHSFQKSAALLAKDLYIAHEVLAVRGGNRRTEDAPEFTWTDFCDAVGISRKTAMLWMRLYDPVEDRVRTPEELAPMKSANLQIDDGGHEARVAHAMATGERLAGWTQDDEKEFKKRKANEHFAELADKWMTKKIKTNFKGRDYFSEAIQNAKQYARFTLETKDQTLAQMELLEHISNYLKSFEDPSTRLAAGYNIGLRVREVINEFANQMAELNQFDSVEVEK